MIVIDLAVASVGAEDVRGDAMRWSEDETCISGR